MIFVIDLFCGAGGFSEGVRQAGAKVVLGVDSWKDAVDVHAANHPESDHWCEDLGGDPVSFVERLTHFVSVAVPAGAHVHLHASPPCQLLSKANRSTRDPESGLELMRFTLDVISSFACASWTLEQVSAPAVRKLFDSRNVMYKHMHCDKMGVPSIRKRLVGASFSLDGIYMDEKPPMVLSEVMNEANMEHPTGFDVQRDGSRKNTRRGLNEVSYTVTTRAPVLWSDEAGREKALTKETYMALQTFPLSYKLGKQWRRMIANAVPPEMARRVMLHITRESSAY
jgi:site-specific DNA-cytosine methylase